MMQQGDGTHESRGREPSRAERSRASLCKDADDVVAGDNVIEAHLLARGELAALAVDERILELVDEARWTW